MGYLNKYVKIGILVILSTLLLLWGINFLKGKNVFSNNHTIYATYNEIEGLSTSDPVMFKGFKIGQVNEITYDFDQDKFVLKFLVNENIKIPKGTKAKIYSTNFLGNKAIRLLLTKSKTYCIENDTIEGLLEDDIIKLLNEKIQPVENLIVDLNKVLKGVNSILDEKTQNNIKQGLSNLNIASGNFKKFSRKLNSSFDFEKVDSIFTDVKSITQNLKANSGGITSIIKNLNSITTTFNKNLDPNLKDVKKFISNVNKLTDKLNSKDGSAGLMLNDKKMYQELSKTLENLKELLVNIKKKPKKYFKFSVF